MLVKIPWKDQVCQVEVDELELVLAPCQEKYELGLDMKVVVLVKMVVIVCNGIQASLGIIWGRIVLNLLLSRS